jgi:hypothetical protein
MGLNVFPYYQMQDLAFRYIDEYNINGTTEKLMFRSISQDYSNMEYECQKMAMYFQVPDDELLFHSQNIKHGFGFTQEVFASSCYEKPNGWNGTLEKVDHIDISSTFDYDETHLKGYDLSDIVWIFAYVRNVEINWRDEDLWVLLEDYNSNSPYEAPKRFYLLIKSPPTLSKEQQFYIRYYLANEEGAPSKYFEVKTPVFKVKTSY